MAIVAIAISLGVAKALLDAFSGPDGGGSWGDPDDGEAVPRELRWTRRDATSYGGEHQVPTGMDEENAKAAERTAADLGTMARGLGRFSSKARWAAQVGIWRSRVAARTRRDGR